MIPENSAKAIQQLGYQQSSSPTYNLLKDLMEKLPTKDDLKEAVADYITMWKIQSRPQYPQQPAVPTQDQQQSQQQSPLPPPSSEYTEEEIEKRAKRP